MGGTGMKMRKSMLYFSTILILILAMIIPLKADNGRAWSIVATYEVPEGASGLAFDGTYLYCGIYGSNGGNVYQIDPADGSYTLAFTGPQEDAYGLTYDGTYIWTTDHPGSSSSPAIAMQVDMSGSLISQFNLPDHYMSGIAYDNGDFWVSTYYPDPGTIYKVDGSGTIIKQFTPPNDQPWDLCTQGDYLWMTDYWADALYKIDTATGNMLESYASESNDPAGIVWDGQYLWYCDNGGSTSYDLLYKIDLYGAGTPIIGVSNDTHDYGVVVVNESDTWDLTVSNIGASTLTISGVTFSGSGDLSTTATFPLEIDSAGSDLLPIIWTPTAAGPLNATATIHSNDPLNPDYDLTLLGDAVYSGPDIDLPQPSHDYSIVRAGAHTRWFMEVRNEGSSQLTITGISIDEPAFYLDNSVSLPIDIPVLGSVDIGVWFNPDMDMIYNGTLTITSNDPNESPLDVPLSGEGDDSEWPISTQLWQTSITGGTDNSVKAVASLPDITGDGVADVVICSEDYTIRCFNGNSHGQADLLWEHEIYGGSVYNQSGIDIIEDVDSDGYSDVVVGSSWGGKLIRVLSGKTGTEIWTHYTNEYGDGGWVYQVDASFDYNGDNVTDVLAATGDDADDTGPRRIYCLDGLTGLSIWERPVGAPVFSVIGIEDFTGDGIPDALAGSSNSDESEGRVFAINGSSSLIEWTFIPNGSSVWALAQIDDINGDGIKDVAIGDFSFSAGYVFGLDAVDGDELFSAGPIGVVLQLAVMDDLNGDGYHDLAPSHSGASAIAIDGYNGGYIFSEPLVDKAWNVANAGDLSGDGISDLFIGTLYNNNYCYFINGINGEELASVSFGPAIDGMNAIPDIVGDESMELVAGGRDGSVVCYSGGISTLINDPPSVPTIVGNTSGSVNTNYKFDIESVDPDGNDVYYYIVWGDGISDEWIGPYASGELLKADHTYDSAGTFEIQAKAKDIYDAESPWSAVHEIVISAMCGDANGDQNVDVSDAVWIINYVFVNGDPPDPFDTGDANCDGGVDVSDAVWIINYVFVDGYDPCDTDGDGIPDC